MAIPKQNVAINFSEGLDTKTDPFQVSPGKFLALQNTVFTKGGLLQKQNGFAQITSLPQDADYLTTFNGNLTAVGASLQAFSDPSNSWVSVGAIQPVDLSVLPIVRNSLNQTQADSAISENGLICVAYSESDGSATSYKYAVFDQTTGQSVISAATLEATTEFSPRVFYLGTYFIIVYTSHPAAYNLRYVAISSTSLAVSSAVTISTSITPSARLAHDGVVYNNKLYLAWNGAASSGIKVATLTSTLTLSSTINPDPAHVATIVSVCADSARGTIWVSYYDSSGATGYTLALSATTLATILAATQFIASGTYLNLSSSAQSGSVTIFRELSAVYSYDGAIATNRVEARTCTEAAALGVAYTVLRSVGLASKSFIIDSTIYFLASYSSPYQKTYFLINGSTSTQAAPVVVAKLAYQNGGGYLATGTPAVSVSESAARVVYRFADLIAPVNKNTNVASGNQTAGIYAQFGINLATFDLTSDVLQSSEIGKNLHLTGGYLWMYDGVRPVEHGFHLYPDSVEATATATAGGNLAAQIYYYQAIYSWTDNQGNIHQSAPSIPVKKDISGSGTATNTITVQLPTLRITSKTNVKIELYRWSTAQQTYYQITSITAPTMSSATADSVSFTDTFADATILGNSIIYTNGGVIENIGAPAVSAMALYKNRLMALYAEDRNVVGYSKQVIEGVPVEMSDLFTMFIAPTIGAQGSTGPTTALAAMDDKFIIFKRDAIYYVTGTGPDNTGSNNDFSEPFFITSTVGCDNQRSIVLMPNGLMFQSDKGIWLLGRDLSTQYIGAPVEGFNGATVTGALAIPETNQVRFTLSTGKTVSYDYYYGQWNSAAGTSATSVTLYQNRETLVDQYSRIFQETPGLYLNGSSPVLITFTTGWFNLAGLQGYLRAYYFYFLGQYLSPHKLTIQIAYDYNPAPQQQTVITPINSVSHYGDDPFYGGSSPYGGVGSLEQWQIFFTNQRCQAFQLTVTESFDSLVGQAPGAGFTLSGINLVIGVKSRWPTLPAVQSAS